MNDQSVSFVIAEIRTQLSAIYPKGEIEAFIKIIFRQLLNYQPVDILLRKDSILPGFIVEKIHKVVEDLLKNRPIQYIFRQTRFYGHNLYVDERVLIPRQETEELVDRIVRDNVASDLRVLDCCTGSGCIAVSLARALKFPSVEAFDISEQALAVAEINAKTLNVKVKFSQKDALSLPADNSIYDIIVSNPPYIGESEKADMEANVLNYEPHLALFVPDNDVLQFYKAIAEYSSGALKSGGKLYFEINHLYANNIKELLHSLHFSNIEIATDISRRARFVIAHKEVEKW
ncbi:MAG: peptide chain release factor N(5)-glutamine methyltransferase [Candidatus Limisoma sp.]